MKKITLSLVATFIIGLMTAPASWAGRNEGASKTQQAPQLYQQCQERLQKNPNEEAKKLCDEGMELHRQGKQDEAIKTLKQGLEKIEG